MSEGVSIRQAARQLKRSPHTIRRWLRQGAPYTDRGTGTKGHGARVDPEALEQWYGRTRGLAACQNGGFDLDRLAAFFLEFLIKDAGLSHRAHEMLDMDRKQAARYLILLYRFLSIELSGEEPAPEFFSDSVKALLTIADMRNRNGRVGSR
ncbi:hypothetical protein [Nitrospira sp. Nam80]